MDTLPANFTREVEESLYRIMEWNGNGDRSDIQYLFMVNVNQTTAQQIGTVGYYTVVEAEVVLTSYISAQIYSRQAESGGRAVFEEQTYFTSRSFVPEVNRIHLYSDWHETLEKIIIVNDDDDGLFVEPNWLSNSLLVVIIILGVLGCFGWFYDHTALVKHIFHASFRPMFDSAHINPTKVLKEKRVHPST